MQNYSLKDVVLSSADFQELEQEIKKGSLARSILLISKDGPYAFELAKVLSSYIFADGKESDMLYEKIMAGAHPDLKIYPQKDKLLTADSEDIVSESFIKPIFSQRKIFIIQNIDEGMEGAQNKLLKTLEEPPHNVYFILTCQSLDKVLPTIRSRCNKVELKKVSEENISKLLHEGDQEKLQLILAVSDGQIGKAEKLAKKRNFVDLCKDSVSALTTLSSSKEVLALSKKLQQYTADLPLILDCFALALEDLMLIKAGKETQIRLKPMEQQLIKASNGYTMRALCEISSLFVKFCEEKSYNVSQVLSLENFLLNILEVKYLCK